jgi:poly(A) polymerase
MLFSKSKILPKLPNRKALISLAELSARENVKLYLVGGTIRDLILERPIVDLDFSLPVDAIEFAKNFAKEIGVKFIALDEEQKTARLIFRGGSLYMDFSSIRGNDIIEDLLARDLTINSMAIDFNKLMQTDSIELIDPYNAIDDLYSGLIRIPSAQTILNDPLRMLRAYRFSATLGFSLYEDSVNLITDYAELLKISSVERVRDELYKIFDIGNCAKFIRAMDKTKLLEQIFPEIIQMKGMIQNDYHHLDVWGHSLLALEFFESNAIPNSLIRYESKINSYLDFEIVKGRTRRSLLKLAIMLHDVGKPLTRSVDKNGRIRFFDHHKKGAEIALQIGNRLKFANRETQSLSNIVENHMYPLFLCSQKNILRREKTRNILNFIKKMGSDCLAVLIIAFADLNATQGIKRSDDDLKNLNELISEIADTYFHQLDSPIGQLINGDELINRFGMSQGVAIGKMLALLKEAQINGVINDHRQAMNFVRDILDKSNRTISLP